MLSQPVVRHEGYGGVNALFMGRDIRPALPGQARRWFNYDQRRALRRPCARGWLDSFGYELPGEEGEAWSRFLNEFQMRGTDGFAWRPA